MKLTTYVHLVPILRLLKIYTHSSIQLHSVIFNLLSIGKTYIPEFVSGEWIKPRNTSSQNSRWPVCDIKSHHVLSLSLGFSCCHVTLLHCWACMSGFWEPSWCARSHIIAPVTLLLLAWETVTCQYVWN